MEPLTQRDLWPNAVYEKARDEFRARIIELKKPRRIALGNCVTLLFENRETLKFQIQEMVRAEGITSPAGLQGELDVYNGLMPSTDGLSGTLTVEITDEAKIPEMLHRLLGLEETLVLTFGGCELHASFEAGRSDGQRISAVQFVRFQFDPADRAAFLSCPEARLELRHPGYQAVAPLGPTTLASLRRDLEG
ncbi:MAG: DUF3501 family protein [Deltaproteobacteria bacterium]